MCSRTNPPDRLSWIRPRTDRTKRSNRKSNPQHELEETQHDEPLRKPKAPMVGWLLLGCVVLLASIVVLIAVGRAVGNRTDDAQVLANFIGMAPQVDGPIMELPIRDNQVRQAGDLLFVVDGDLVSLRWNARSQQAALEGQIEDRRRSIARRSAASMWRRRTSPASTSNRDALNATISEAEANLADSRAALLRAEADRKYSADNLHRLDPCWTSNL